jgi:hypothetical protein
MPCQTELQACPPNNFKHPTREDPVVNRSSPPHANARNIQRLQERKRHSHVSAYVSPCAVINSDEHTFLNTSTDHPPPQEKDMKSKPPTPHTAVPDIRPSLSGTQSPLTRSLRPRVLGSAEALPTHLLRSYCTYLPCSAAAEDARDASAYLP